MKEDRSARLMTTTEGRAKLPDILQDAHGHGTMTGFHRYGRMHGAIISLTAVRMLVAPDTVDAATRARLQKYARALLAKVEAEGLR